MSLLCVNWITLRDFSIQRNLSIQWILVDEITYRIRAYDGVFGLDCTIPLDGNSDQVDFETNFKNNGNKSPYTQVTTQYEVNDKDLKLARGSANVDESKTALISIKIPGIFGSGNGRYIAGGYGISDDYDKDDFALAWISDEDRNIGWAVALSQNQNANAPIPDEVIKGMGYIPGIGSFPNYPIIKSFNDEDLPKDNRGWYFWSDARGNGQAPCGEVEIEPIAGYGFLPSGFYINISYNRKTLTTGSLRLNIYWGQRG